MVIRVPVLMDAFKSMLFPGCVRPGPQLGTLEPALHYLDGTSFDMD